MNDPINKFHRRLLRYDLPGHTYFIGCCTEKRRPLLEIPRLAETIILLYGDARDREEIRFLHAYVVMPDHYHMLLTLNEQSSVSRLVQGIHSRLYHKCRDLLAIRSIKFEGTGDPSLKRLSSCPTGKSLTPRTGRIWQKRFYDHVIRDEKDFISRYEYIHNNPVEKGLVENALFYPWSSCVWWETGQGVIRCDPW